MKGREAESYGYTGKILRVDLRNEKISVLKQDEGFYRLFLFVGEFETTA